MREIEHEGPHLSGIRSTPFRVDSASEVSEIQLGVWGGGAVSPPAGSGAAPQKLLKIAPMQNKLCDVTKCLTMVAAGVRDTMPVTVTHTLSAEPVIVACVWI